MLLGMAMYSAAEIQSLQRQRPEQTVALFSMVKLPTLNRWGPNKNLTVTICV